MYDRLQASSSKASGFICSWVRLIGNNQPIRARDVRKVLAQELGYLPEVLSCERREDVRKLENDACVCKACIFLEEHIEEYDLIRDEDGVRVGDDPVCAASLVCVRMENDFAQRRDGVLEEREVYGGENVARGNTVLGYRKVKVEAFEGGTASERGWEPSLQVNYTVVSIRISE